jgi:hypothetical protein
VALAIPEHTHVGWSGLAWQVRQCRIIGLFHQEIDMAVVKVTEHSRKSPVFLRHSTPSRERGNRSAEAHVKAE